MPTLNSVRPRLAVSCFRSVNAKRLGRTRRSRFLGTLISGVYFFPFVIGLNSASGAAAAPLAAAPLAAAPPAAAPPAAANSVTLAHQWAAGQKWNYDMNLDGKVTVRLPQNAGLPMIAGMELKDIAYKSSARLTLDVLEADADGLGTIAPRADRLAMTAEVGTVALEIENGEITIFYGETMLGQPRKLPLDALKSPRNALRLNARGHFEGSSPIAGAAPAPAPAPGLGANQPFNLAAITQMFDPSILPTLWPDHAVAPGDIWSSEVVLPIKTGDADADAKLASAGTFKFSYVAPETDSLKRVLHKVHVEGAIKISEAQAALLAAQIGDKSEGKTLDSIQKVNGDLWFDAAVGQIRRADAKLQTYTAREASAIVAGQEQDNNSWFIFDGRVRLDLRDPPATPKPPTR